jgi:transposase-like protein
MDHHEENEKMGRPSSFSEAYKREAVAQAAASGNISQTARALGISNKSLHSWIRTYGEPKRLDAETASAQELAARVRQLEKQLAIRERQIEVLKKAIGIVSEAEGNATR